MTKEKLLEQAKIMFPLGTKYYCQQDLSIFADKSKANTYTIDEYFYNNIRIGYFGDDDIDAKDYGFIRYNGVWAEIVESASKDLNYEIY